MSGARTDPWASYAQIRKDIQYNMDHEILHTGAFEVPEHLNGFDALQWEIKKLRGAAVLLEQVYSDVGPYRRGEIDDATLGAIKDFFGFDDSE